MGLINSNDVNYLQIADPEEVGLSAERLERIRPCMQAYIDRHEVPCVVTLVARHGKIAYFEVQGMIDIDAKVPAKKDTIFRIFSMTKPITAVATLILYEEGCFQLDDPIFKFLPAFKNPVVKVSELPRGQRWGVGPFIMTVPAHREITIRDCLTHTTGLAQPELMPLSMLATHKETIRGLGWEEGGDPIEESETSFPTMKKRIDCLAKLPLFFHPGTAWSYGMSNCVAGVLVEVASGKTLEEFFKERIFDPLGMKDSSFYLPESKLNRFATNYLSQKKDDEWGLKVIDRPETSKSVKGPKVFFSGGGQGGGVLSTAADYARFAQMLLNGGELGGVRLLSRKTVELMTTNHTGDLYIYIKGHGYGYGFGVGIRTNFVDSPRVGSIGQYGWSGAACTHYFADPKEDLFGLLFSQVIGAFAKPDFNLTEDFETLIYQAII